MFKSMLKFIQTWSRCNCTAAFILMRIIMLIYNTVTNLTTTEKV